MLSDKHTSKGPNGQKRPADVIGNAVHVMRLATDEIEETLTEDGKNKAAVELGRKGGMARTQALSGRRSIEIAKKAAVARWRKKRSSNSSKACSSIRLSTRPFMIIEGGISGLMNL